MVKSETGTLGQVIIHHPDDGIEVVTPKKALEFLYDDIVFLPRMKEEHSLFRHVLRIFLGSDNVLDTQDLLFEVLDSNIEAKNKLLEYIFEMEDCSEAVRSKLSAFPTKELVYTLYTGIHKKENTQIFSPLPNYVFTRDIGVVVNDHIIICQASKKPRTRETVLTRGIMYYHPIFKRYQVADKIIDLTTEGDKVSLEGGDVMVYNEKYLLLGCSERSTEKAINSLKSKLFEKDVIEYVVQIDIPHERTSMHIDTLFTQISKNDFVVFAPHITQPGKLKVSMYQKGLSSPKNFETLKDFFLYANPNSKFIHCGNGEYPFDEREQWTDGCNLLAVKEGVAIAYHRNFKTGVALQKAGYSMITAKKLIADFKKGNFDPSRSNNLIITIPATELSRARGGPHCLSFPISRS